MFDTLTHRVPQGHTPVVCVGGDISKDIYPLLDTHTYRGVLCPACRADTQNRKTDGGLNELALFAGAGGGILGGRLLGWRTICAVERDAFAAAVLAQRQNDGCLLPFPIWSDVETFDGRPWRGRVDVVSGGFPCTDISCAGKGAGIDGPESGLWRHMARIIREVGPGYVLVENSPMLTVRGLGRVLGDLAKMGYDAQWGVLSAADAIWLDCLARGHQPALDHLRERIWIVATRSDANRYNWGANIRESNAGADGRNESTWILSSRADAARSEPQPGPGRRRVRTGGEESHATGSYCIGKRLQGVKQARTEKGATDRPGHGDNPGWWSTEPELGRLVHGLADRVDRCKALGNGQVPAVVRLAWDTLSDMAQFEERRETKA